MIALRSPAQRALSADLVVVGKVTAIEKETVELPPFPGAPNKAVHRVALVKIATNLAGAANLTHVKIGFVPPVRKNPAASPPPARGIARPVRGPLPALELKEGQEMLFFLSRHPSGEFYVMPVMSPPIEINGDAAKKELEAVKSITDTISDSMKGLKNDEAAVRARTATIMVMKYRSYPEFAREVEQVAINGEESKLILQGLAEGEWAPNVRPVPGAEGSLSAYTAFLNLGLTKQDGWKQPIVTGPQPGRPQPDFTAIQKTAFTNWLAGPGRDYVVKKIVPK